MTINSLVGISIILLNTGIGLLLIVLSFKEPISGLNAFSARSMFSDIILLLLIKFIQIIALRSLVAGVPKA